MAPVEVRLLDPETPADAPPILAVVIALPDKLRALSDVAPIAPLTDIVPPFEIVRLCVAASAPLIVPLNVTPLPDGLIVVEPVNWTFAGKLRLELVVISPPIWINVGGPAKVMVLAKTAPVVDSVPVDVRATVVNSLSAAPMAHTLAVADPELTFSTAPFEPLRIVPFENVMALFAAVKVDVAPALTLILLPTPVL